MSLGEPPALTAVPAAQPHKSEHGKEIDRLMALSPEALNAEDLRYLKRLRDCRASLLEVEEQMEELREIKKARREAMEEALQWAAMHFDNRQLALNFGGGA